MYLIIFKKKNQIHICRGTTPRLPLSIKINPTMFVYSKLLAHTGLPQQHS